MSAAIQPDTLVVLANHRQAGVRAAVVRVICALHRRHAAALPHHCLVQLANQVLAYILSIQHYHTCIDGAPYLDSLHAPCLYVLVVPVLGLDNKMQEFCARLQLHAKTM